jgi:sugar phosphate isomerase/epimerase
MRLHSAAVAAVATLAMIAANPSHLAAADKRDDSAAEKLGFKLSLQCWTFRNLTFFETIDQAAALGIKYLEAFPGQKLKPGSSVAVNSDMSDEVCSEIKTKLADAGGLKLVAFGVVATIPTDEKEARKTFEWAKKMGIEVLVTETIFSEMLDKLCNEYNIKLALHNHPKTWPPEQVLAACKDRSNLIGSCGDTGHWARAGRVPIDTLKKMEGRMLHLHFKDLDPANTKGHDAPWGTGQCDATGMLQELKRQGYHGYFSIEYERATPEELAKNLPLCVAFFDHTAAKLAK